MVYGTTHTWPNRPRTNDLQNRVLLWSFQSCRTMLAVFVQNAHGLTWIQCETIWGILVAYACSTIIHTTNYFYIVCMPPYGVLCLRAWSRGGQCVFWEASRAEMEMISGASALCGRVGTSNSKCIQVPTIPSAFAYKLLATLKSIVHFSAEQIF